MLIFSLIGCGDAVQSPVRATLDDGQILVGQITTETVELETGFGTTLIPLDDIGQIAPVEGGALGDSGDNVSVWLRNGAEIHGRWTEPELTMQLRVGGRRIGVEVPTGGLQRFQLQGGEMTPRGIVFRVKTVFGDDLLVDAEASSFAVENELGRFEPVLSECSSLVPMGDGSWQVTLTTGTVLVANPVEDDLRLVLAMGPEDVVLPLRDVSSIGRQDWGQYRKFQESYRGSPAAPLAMPDAAGEAEWYNNGTQSAFKGSL